VLEEGAPVQKVENNLPPFREERSLRRRRLYLSETRQVLFNFPQRKKHLGAEVQRVSLKSIIDIAIVLYYSYEEGLAV
jgi:hypothetical protein